MNKKVKQYHPTTVAVMAAVTGVSNLGLTGNSDKFNLSQRNGRYGLPIVEINLGGHQNLRAECDLGSAKRHTQKNLVREVVLSATQNIAENDQMFEMFCEEAESWLKTFNKSKGAMAKFLASFPNQLVIADLIDEIATN